MANDDFYDRLGVGRDADADTLKKAYRKLAMKHHPDRNPNNDASELKLKGINEAYDVLKDPQKKAAYDRYGHDAFQQGGGRGGPGFGGFGGQAGGGFADIFDEVFGDFMGGGGRQSGDSARRGSDLRYNMEISLEEAFAGDKTTIRIPASTECDSCHGTGAAGGAAPITCPTCHGHGRVRSQSGFFTVERTCPSCQGSGQVIKDPCRNCGGTGRVRKEKSLAVTIPPGVEDGTRIRLAGEGEAGLRGAQSGDLYIFLSVKAHRIFQRDGANIFCRVPIPMTTAALGGTIDVPTVDGSRARVNIPAGTQTGHQFRMKGKGMSVLRSNARGDMFVQTTVETPVNLTRRQQELLKEFGNEGTDEKQSPESHGFFAKVKDLWEDLKD